MTSKNDNTQVNLTRRETANPIATLLLMLEEALGRSSDTPADYETKKQLSVITENAIWSINNWSESVSTMLGDRINQANENEMSQDELSLVSDSVNLLRQLSVINDALNDLRGLAAVSE
jgi:hypothetical protein